jgi:hypothetical protein
MEALRTASPLDPSTVPDSGALYFFGLSIFTWGGVSFGLGGRFVERSRRAAERSGSHELAVYVRFMDFVQGFVVGSWGPGLELDEAFLERSIREGRLWEVFTYYGLAGELAIYRGDFARAEEWRARVEEVWDLYQHHVAQTNRFALPALLELERRRLGPALDAAERYYDENPEELLHLIALGVRGQVETLQGDLGAAEKSLERAAGIAARNKPLIPFHDSAWLRARYLLDLTLLEGALGAGDAARLRELRRRARRTGGATLRAASRVACRRTFAYRLAGRHAWLLGQRRKAQRWWERSLESGRNLGARPELARTHAELALRLGPGEALAGWSSEEHRLEALGLFERLGLEWDLARLEEQRFS